MTNTFEVGSQDFHNIGLKTDNSTIKVNAQGQLYADIQVPAYTAGENIDITEGVISATDTTYTEGVGIDITENVISADTDVLATKVDLASKQEALTAVSPVSIYDTHISNLVGFTISGGIGMPDHNVSFGNSSTTLNNVTLTGEGTSPEENPDDIYKSYIDIPYTIGKVVTAYTKVLLENIIFGYKSDGKFIPVFRAHSTNGGLFNSQTGTWSSGSNSKIYTYTDKTDLTMITSTAISSQRGYEGSYGTLQILDKNSYILINNVSTYGAEQDTWNMTAGAMALIRKIDTVRYCSSNTSVSLSSFGLFDVGGVDISGSGFTKWRDIPTTYTNEFDATVVTNYHNITTKYDNNTIKVNSDGELYADIDISTKQNITDNTLTTTSKTIVGAINEVNDKAGGGVPIGTIYSVNCTADYVPDGALPCDGSEYTKAQFNDLWTNYLAADTPLLNTCSYADYQSDITTYGSCGKFAIDTVNEKFKVPTIINKIYQGANATLPVRGNGITVGWTDGTNYGGSVQATQGYGFYASGGYNVAVGTATTENDGPTGRHVALGITTDSTKSGIEADNTNSNKEITTLRYFVQVATGQINQSMMDWAQWASSLVGKLSTDVSTNITTEGKSYISGLGMLSNRYIDLTLGASGTAYTAPANGWVSFSRIFGGNQGFYLFSFDSTGNIAAEYSTKAPEYCALGGGIPIRAGQTFMINYEGTGTTEWFRFYYAEGEEE